jgi:type I restriction enzyme M protein
VNPEPFLLKAARQRFCNTSPLDLRTLLGDQDHVNENLRAYVS